MPQIELSLGWVFAQATGAVQGVLVILILSSVICWAIILEKSVILYRYRRQTRQFEDIAQSNNPGSTVSPGGELPDAILKEGRSAWAQTAPGENPVDRRNCVERAMRDAVSSVLLRAERRLPYLATIGSVAPFVGLFGTVWGIMHSFVSIAHTNDTSLAVVAPGIAESLFTTAAGLVTAIPASVAYNKIAADFNSLSRRLSLAIAAITRKAPARSMEAVDDAA
ncbi:MotA/TolQ/ExbB proton channel family protein [Desulfovibrio inopinatus]|uniref:MotA/TolQ/ExbB proton channel family protein n=1 Tax=Desulfovibrio inopinatus TaxID=102109 RepID=UPI0004135090|nr:MotA/TolQ/ExbB proton channel family protein [Desulfovibrio inopinatus]